jgi:lipopolysaccharide transport system permease protein
MRDIQQGVPFLIQLWFFATPVAYPSSLVGSKWRLLYGLNPMTGVVEGFRWALLGTGGSLESLLGLSFITALVVLVSGALFFRRMEDTFADLV